VDRPIARFTCLLAGTFLALAVQSAAIATLTIIADSPDQHNEPNLLGVNPFPGNPNPSVLETLYGESNLRRIDDSLDIAFKHTGNQASVKAVARFNNPSLEDRFRYFNLASGMSPTVLVFQRVPPNFLFPVGYNPPMMLSGLIPLADSGQVFEVGLRERVRSNPARNDFAEDLMVTFEIVGAAGHPNNQVGNYVVAWEGFARTDSDFQDVVYEISGVVPVPEPAGLLMAALALACTSLVCRRRRR
jgi:hypothetical protein